MTEERLPLFIGVDTIKADLGVSRAKAYEVIKELNAEMKAQNPRAIVVNASLLAPLFEANKITVDLAAHYKPDGKWRDHGVLFKMMPDDLPLLLGEPKEYIL